MKKFFLAFIMFFSFSAFAWEKTEDYDPVNIRAIMQKEDGKVLSSLVVVSMEDTFAVGSVKALDTCLETPVTVTVNNVDYKAYQSPDTINGFPVCYKVILGLDAEKVISVMLNKKDIVFDGRQFTTHGFSKAFVEYVK